MTEPYRYRRYLYEPCAGGEHKWELFVADDVLPYSFCRKCKSTMFQGGVYPLKA